MPSRLTGIPRQRIATHGDFRESAGLCQHLKECVRMHSNWKRMSPEQREAMEMILFKASRIVSGDPDHRDHWADIAGYGELGRAACRPKRRAKR